VQALNLATGQTLAVKQIHLANIPKSEVKVIMVCTCEVALTEDGNRFVEESPCTATGDLLG
jgi:hypothetical protein